MDNDSDNHHHGLSSPVHHDFSFLLCKRHNHSDSLRFKKEALVIDFIFFKFYFIEFNF